MTFNIKKFQEGGPAPAPDAAASAQQGGQDPMTVLIQGAQQAVQTQDCATAMQVCQMLLEVAGQGAQQAPVEEAPAPEANPQEPVYGKGGKLIRRISK